MIGKCNTGGGGKPEEEKTVTAGTSVIEVLPSSGKTMKKVTVNPTPSQSKTVTPLTSQQTVSPDSGKLLSKVIVKAMEDVTPEVTAQTPVITQIAEKFGVSITTPSGTNKQILQGNNANLLNIKNNAKKEGAYVWKKYEYTPAETVTNPSFTMNITAYSSTVTISDENFDLTKIGENWKKFFDGFTTTNGHTMTLNGSTLTYSSHDFLQFNPIDKTFTIDGSWKSPNRTNFSYSGTKVFVEDSKKFIDFVVSDSETAYPDGGIQGGYWYEKVVGIDVILSLLGCTKYSVDKIIPASNISNVYVTPFNHTLGEIPKYALLRANGHSASTDGYWEIIEGFGSNIEVNAGYSTMYTGYDGEQYTYNSYPPNMTENTIGFSCSGSMRAMAGIEYTLITMA